MSPFEFIEHTADIGVRVSAPTMEELFQEAAAAMFAAVSSDPPSGWNEKRSVSLEAPDAESLIVDWLNELLYLLEVKLFWAVETRVSLSGNSTRLEADVSGVKMEGTIEGTEIKAVTYHLLEIHPVEEGFETDIYFDV